MKSEMVYLLKMKVLAGVEEVRTRSVWIGLCSVVLLDIVVREIICYIEILNKLPTSR